MNKSDFDHRLSRLADICLRVGVNLQRGQELIVTAPLDARRLVHHITRLAYSLGAKNVICLYDDPDMMLDRFKYVDESALDYAPQWIHQGMADAMQDGAARLYVVAPYPDLLSDVTTDNVVRAHAALAKASEVETKLTSESLVNWSTIPFVTDDWATTVFSETPSAEASQRLWDAVFNATRIDSDNPVDAWSEHCRSLNRRRDILQSRGFATLRFYDGRTDLEVGLVDGHRWVGGTVTAANGIQGICNIPTEEVFTCPHRERTNGRVFFSKPLALAGTIVDGLSVEFRDGAVTSVRAKKGQDTFEKLISGDDGSKRLGEIGLVPHSSPISRSEILFYNPLFDENASSHIAFGQSYAACLPVDLRSPGFAERAGANQSAIHIDCMLGNSEMSVDGILENGTIEPLMRKGEFIV